MTEAIWLALRGEGRETVRREITTRYGYNLEQGLEAIERALEASSRKIARIARVVSSRAAWPTSTLE